MIKIEIHEEVSNAEEMVDLLNEIATKVKEGYTSGYHPGWTISGEEEKLSKCCNASMIGGVQCEACGSNGE